MVGYGGKDLQKMKLLSLDWKSEGAMHRPLRGAGSVHLPGVRPSLCPSVCLSRHGPQQRSLLSWA